MQGIAIFKSAFMGTGQFEETAQKSMKLPEDDPETIDSMIQWVYFKSFPFDRKAATKDDHEAQIALQQLASLYVAADKFEIIGLKNELINQLFKYASRKSSYVPNDDVVEYIYSNTIPGSNLRRLTVDWHAEFVGRQWFKDRATAEFVRQNSEFVADLLARMSTMLEGRRCSWPDRKHRFLEDTGSEKRKESPESEESEEVSDTGTGDMSSSGNDTSSTI